MNLSCSLRSAVIQWRRLWRKLFRPLLTTSCWAEVQVVDEEHVKSIMAAVTCRSRVICTKATSHLTKKSMKWNSTIKEKSLKPTKAAFNFYTPAIVCKSQQPHQSSWCCRSVFWWVYSVSDSPADDNAVLRALWATHVITERWEETADMAAGNQPDREGTLGRLSISFLSNSNCRVSHLSEQVCDGFLKIIDHPLKVTRHPINTNFFVRVCGGKRHFLLTQFLRTKTYVNLLENTPRNPLSCNENHVGWSLAGAGAAKCERVCVCVSGLRH